MTDPFKQWAVTDAKTIARISQMYSFSSILIATFRSPLGSSSFVQSSSSSSSLSLSLSLSPLAHAHTVITFMRPKTPPPTFQGHLLAIYGERVCFGCHVQDGDPRRRQDGDGVAHGPIAAALVAGVQALAGEGHLLQIGGRQRETKDQGPL